MRDSIPAKPSRQLFHQTPDLHTHPRLVHIISASVHVRVHMRVRVRVHVRVRVRMRVFSRACKTILHIEVVGEDIKSAWRFRQSIVITFSEDGVVEEIKVVCFCMDPVAIKVDLGSSSDSLTEFGRNNVTLHCFHTSAAHSLAGCPHRLQLGTA